MIWCFTLRKWREKAWHKCGIGATTPFRAVLKILCL